MWPRSTNSIRTFQNSVKNDSFFEEEVINEMKCFTTQAWQGQRRMEQVKIQSTSFQLEGQKNYLFSPNV